MPMANHVSGRQQDLDAYADLQWNLRLLMVYLVLGWVLGGLVEELAYRGYLLTRIRDAVGRGRGPAVAAAALGSSWSSGQRTPSRVSSGWSS
jgi:membrane protease YdiL (CAAX protease family)